MSVTATLRPRWSLQTRLILTVVSIVGLILVAIGVTTATALRSIVVDSLDTQLSAASHEVTVIPGRTAYETLSVGRQRTGTLLIVQTLATPTGAYVGSDTRVVELTAREVDDILAKLDPRERVSTVTLPELGEYRVYVQVLPTGAFVVLGMSAAEQTATVARILTIVALVTVGGLLLLAAIIAFVIRRALRPLRSVAATAARVAAQPLAHGDVSITERVPDDEADATDEIGRVGAALNTLLDHVDASLTARQRNEERMRAFVADASHELRTPLAAIRGYSELSLRTIRDGQGARVTKAQLEAGAAQTKEGLERIQSASLRMTSLVEDLLLLARLDEGKELVYGAVDLTRVAVDAVADAQAAGPDHEWIIEADPQPVVVAGDAVRLHQVIANLLTNARVHTPAGTTVTASVTASGASSGASSGGAAVVRVHDDGPGIDPAVAGGLFERFARADASRTRQTGGTGLGLSIAKAIVTAQHGTITVDSRPGSTTFEVRLPARPADPVGSVEPVSPES